MSDLGTAIERLREAASVTSGIENGSGGWNDGAFRRFHDVVLRPLIELDRQFLGALEAQEIEIQHIRRLLSEH